MRPRRCPAYWSKPSSRTWTIPCARLGTGDLAVPKKVRRAATGLYERSMAYRTALDAADDTALARALAEHVYLSAEVDRARTLAEYMRTTAASLATADTDQILEGSLDFPAVPVGPRRHDE